MGDVADRIIDLALVERTARPIGEARALVEHPAEQALDEILVADLLAEPERHRRHLRIEQGMGGAAGQVEDDLDILAAGVEDLEHMLVIDEQVHQGGEVDPLRLGIDRRRLLAIGDLDQAQLRPIGVLAHELGVDRDEVRPGEPFAELFEGLGIADQGMDTHRAALIARPPRKTKRVRRRARRGPDFSVDEGGRRHAAAAGRRAGAAMTRARFRVMLRGHWL